MWLRQEEDMDINCGTIIDGEATVEEVGRQIFEMILECASGKLSKSKLLGYGRAVADQRCNLRRFGFFCRNCHPCGIAL